MNRVGNDGTDIFHPIPVDEKSGKDDVIDNIGNDSEGGLLVQQMSEVEDQTTLFIAEECGG